MIDDPYADLGGKRETYSEALARAFVLRPVATLTEQEIAAKIVADRERMKMHDRAFRDDFIQGTEATLVSRTLARQYGITISEPDDDRPAVGGDD